MDCDYCPNRESAVLMNRSTAMDERRIEEIPTSSGPYSGRGYHFICHQCWRALIDLQTALLEVSQGISDEL